MTEEPISETQHVVKRLTQLRAETVANPHFDNPENRKAGTRETKLAKIDAQLAALGKAGK